MSVRHVVLLGCSGGGKSTLLAELQRRGFATVSEPGRRIVEEERRGARLALPWVNLAAFAQRAIDLASEDRRRLGDEAGWVFFDRGLVDAAVALQHAATEVLAPYKRYHRRIFLTPPWSEIYVNDGERQHGLAEAVAEYDRLLIAYREPRYEPIVLPKIGVANRADLILGYID